MAFLLLGYVWFLEISNERKKKLRKMILIFDFFIKKKYERKLNIIKIYKNLYIFKLFNFFIEKLNK